MAENDVEAHAHNAYGGAASDAVHGHFNDFLVCTGLRRGVSELKLPYFTAVRADAVHLLLRTMPPVAEQEGQQTETEATGAPQKRHHTLISKLGALPPSVTLLICRSVNPPLKRSGRFRLVRNVLALTQRNSILAPTDLFSFTLLLALVMSRQW